MILTIRVYSNPALRLMPFYYNLIWSQECGSSSVCLLDKIECHQQRVFGELFLCQILPLKKANLLPPAKIMLDLILLCLDNPLKIYKTCYF